MRSPRRQGLAHDDFAIFFAGNVAGLAVHNEAPATRIVGDE